MDLALYHSELELSCCYPNAGVALIGSIAMIKRIKAILTAVICIVPALYVELTTPATAIAAAPPAVADSDSLRSTVLASKEGAALDSDPLRGGGTDDTAVLQRVLNRAMNGQPVHLLVDGTALVSGLNVYGNTTIDCVEGGGFFLRENSRRAIIRNAHRSRGSVIDEHISIRGCFFNGNRERQLGTTSQHPNQEPDGTFISGLQFLGVNHLTLEKLVLLKIKSFGIWVANGRYIVLRDIAVDNGAPPYTPSLTPSQLLADAEEYGNTDGVHFNGPIQYLTADDLRLRTGDDAVALNANDSEHDDITLTNEMGPYVGQGPITDVVLTNVILQDSALGVRLLSSSQRIDRIVINDVTGTIRGRMAILGHFVIHEHTGNFGSIMFSNINVNPLRIRSMNELEEASAASDQEKEDLADELEVPLFSLNSPIESLILRNVMTTVVDSRPLIRAGRDAAVGDMSVDLNVFDPSMQSVPLELAMGGRVERLSFALNWQGGASDCGRLPIVYNGGKVDYLHWVSTPPTFVGAELAKQDPRVLIVTFSERVKATDFRRGVAISINNSLVSILAATRQASGSIVYFRMAKAARAGDSVTWSYDGSGGTIQNMDGDNLLPVSPKRVVTR